MSSDNYYKEIDFILSDFDNRVLRRDDAIQFIDIFLSLNNDLSLAEVIKLGKVIIILSAHKYSISDRYTTLEKYLLFVYDTYKENIHGIYKDLISNWGHNLNFYYIDTMILNSSQINIYLYFISLNFFTKNAIAMSDASLVDDYKNMKISNKLENYHDIILRIREMFQREEELNSKYFLLSLYFSSLYDCKYYKIDFELFKSDLYLIELYDGIFFSNLFKKVIYYCIERKDQKLIDFLFSRLPTYLNKDIFYEMNSDTRQLIEPISIILSLSNSRDDIDFIYDIYLRELFFDYEAILEEIWSYNREKSIKQSYIFMDDYTEIKENNPDVIYLNELGLFYKLSLILKKNKNYINYRKILNTMENEIKRLESSFSDSSFDNILRIWVLYISSTLGEHEIARESIFNFITNLKYEDIDSPQEGKFLIFLTNYFTYLKDEETLKSLFNFLVSRISNLDEVKIKLVNYLVLISILNNLEDEYIIKFETFFRRDNVPTKIIDELKEYYKNLIGRELE